MLQQAARARAFHIHLIKPTRYDEDGHVIQWLRSSIPSNCLAAVYGIAQKCAESRALGPDVDIVIDAQDECNSVVHVKKIARRIRAGGNGMVGLVGVRSNPFPRALDIARQLRAMDIPVVIGGFHVSGCLAMLPEMPPDLKEALELGIILFAGEAEDRFAPLLRDIDNGVAKPIYDHLADLPALGGSESPFLPFAIAGRVIKVFGSFDAGRGCPFQCSFCTIINVQGRKSRFRSVADLESVVLANVAQGITGFFITDDNFARNRNWEPLLDRLIAFREQEGIRIRLILQVDTLCHRIPGFIEKVARAGCFAVFLGLENINPDSLMGAKKRQNKIWEYRELFDAWRSVKVITAAGYIIGFPRDTPESIAQDIETIKKEIPIDILEFFVLTPLPGSEDHKKLWLEGVPMDPDMNNYDLYWRHRRLWARIKREVARNGYADEAVAPAQDAKVAASGFVRRFAGQIPKTYGAPSWDDGAP